MYLLYGTIKLSRQIFPFCFTFGNLFTASKKINLDENSLFIFLTSVWCNQTVPPPTISLRKDPTTKTGTRRTYPNRPTTRQIWSGDCSDWPPVPPVCTPRGVRGCLRPLLARVPPGSSMGSTGCATVHR